jgi:hypothetical protein
MTPKNNRVSSSSLLSFSASLAFSLVAACAAPEPAIDEDVSVSVSSQSLRNTQVDPDDGKTCYVDGPISGMGKGTMDNGYCCVPSSRPDETCFYCGDPIYECQVAGGDVGVRTGGTVGSIGGVVGNLTGTLSPGEVVPRVKVVPHGIATTLSTAP